MLTVEPRPKVEADAEATGNTKAGNGSQKEAAATLKRPLTKQPPKKSPPPPLNEEANDVEKADMDRPPPPPPPPHHMRTAASGEREGYAIRHSWTGMRLTAEDLEGS